MTTQRFYPHRTAPDGLTLALVVNPALPRRSDGVYDATAEEAGSIQIRGSVEMPAEVLHEVLPPSEAGDPPVEIVLTIRNLEGRQRRRVPVKGRQRKFELSLERHHWVGEVELRAFLLRTKDMASTALDADERLGAEQGIVLSWSEPTIILLDEAETSPPGRALHVEWIRFETTDHLRPFADHLFVLEADDPPKLLLNSGISGLYSTLEAKGTRGAKARIRDAVYMQIGHQVWSSLLASAITHFGILMQEGGAVGLEDLDSWHGHVLRDWAPEMFPAGNADDALPAVIDAIENGQTEELLVSRLPTAIQRRLRSWNAFAGLARDASLTTALDNAP